MSNLTRKEGFLLTLRGGFLITSVLSFIITSAVIFLEIVGANHGVLTYTLDDPYIHLALAENIRDFHYGVNLGEYSAPSSSILWPILISMLSVAETAPLVFNILITMLSIYMVAIQLPEPEGKSLSGFLLGGVFSFLFVYSTNAVGLVYTGMEHSLQVLCVIATCYGMQEIGKTNKVPLWFVVVVVVSPLVRYENMAISASAIMYLALIGQFRASAITSIVMISLLAGFSMYLNYLGLGYFPSSILAKSSIVEGSGGRMESLMSNFTSNISHSSGYFLFFSLILGVASLVFRRNRRAISLVIVLFLGVLMHLLLGRHGWFNRYEIYSLVFSICILFLIYKDELTRPWKYKMVVSGVVVVFIFFGRNYLFDLVEVPQASNNIYSQQFQMHRFVTEYYKNPVAVNDLGWVAYENDNYVLDLWGLASFEALKSRLNEEHDWIERITQEKDVRLVMVYKPWFPKLPKSWVKIGDLETSGKLVTPAYYKVSFYSTNPDEVPYLKELILRYSKTLPKNSKFNMMDL